MLDLQDALRVAFFLTFPITLILTCILAVIIIILHCCQFYHHHDDDDDYNHYLASRRRRSPPSYYHQVIAAEEAAASVVAAGGGPPRFREIDWGGSGGGSYQTFDTTCRSASRDDDPISGGYVADDEYSLSRWGSRTSEWVRTGASFETLLEDRLEEVEEEDELQMRTRDELATTAQKDFGRNELREPSSADSLEPSSRLLRVRSI